MELKPYPIYFVDLGEFEVISWKQLFHFRGSKSDDAQGAGNWNHLRNKLLKWRQNNARVQNCPDNTSFNIF